MDISKKQMQEMEYNTYIHMASELLNRQLNICSGTKQELSLPEKDTFFHKIIDIRWKGNIHFEARTAKGYGWYCISRDSRAISNLYRFHKIDDNTMIHMQHLINDIENGRYNAKKTIKEQITAIVEKRGLTGYMNATKWKELLNEIEINFIKMPIMYKTLFDESEPKYFWSLTGDEDIAYINTAAIEWMKLNPVYTEHERQGALLDDKVHAYSLDTELVTTLRKYNIPYELIEDENVYIVYGYR